MPYSTSLLQPRGISDEALHSAALQQTQPQAKEKKIHPYMITIYTVQYSCAVANASLEDTVRTVLYTVEKENSSSS